MTCWVCVCPSSCTGACACVQVYTDRSSSPERVYKGVFVPRIHSPDYVNDDSHTSFLINRSAPPRMHMHTETRSPMYHHGVGFMPMSHFQEPARVIHDPRDWAPYGVRPSSPPVHFNHSPYRGDMYADPIMDAQYPLRVVSPPGYLPNHHVSLRACVCAPFVRACPHPPGVERCSGSNM